MKNPSGAINTPNKEWGRKNRKEETKLRGLNKKARKDAIKEQS